MISDEGRTSAQKRKLSDSIVAVTNCFGGDSSTGVIRSALVAVSSRSSSV
jgi:hypothetical protein